MIHLPVELPASHKTLIYTAHDSYWLRTSEHQSSNVPGVQGDGPLCLLSYLQF